MAHVILLKAGLAYHRSHLLQTSLIVLGIALGVAVIVAIDMANASISKSFQYSTEHLTGRTTHRIVGSGPGFDQKIYSNIRLNTGYQFMSPMIEGYARVGELNMATLRIVGIDPLSEAGSLKREGILSRLEFGTWLPTLLLESQRVLISDKLAVTAGIDVVDYLAIHAGSS